MSKKLLVVRSNNEFSFPFMAGQDTVWVADPANLVADQTGLIRKGETVWFGLATFNWTLALQQNTGQKLSNLLKRYSVEINWRKAVQYQIISLEESFQLARITNIR